MKRTILILLLSYTPIFLFSQDYTAYLFTYFTGNDMKDEQICYAVSRDGYDYTPLNDGKPVIASDTIALKKAVRDPHILRHTDGWFYQVATDMASSEGWSSNRGIVLMRSRDLIHWQHHAIHFPKRFKGTLFEDVTRVWAPQTIYDEEAGKLMVYFSIKTSHHGSYDLVYYAYANEEFSDLEGEPQVLFDTGSASIDTDIMRDQNGTYHVFYKTEGKKHKDIRQFMAKSLHEPDQWILLPGKCQATTEAVEGSGVFQLTDGSWALMYDCYLKGYYQFCSSQDLIWFKAVKNTELKGHFTPRHGTVIPITEEELERLQAAFPNTDNL